MFYAVIVRALVSLFLVMAPIGAKAQFEWWFGSQAYDSLDQAEAAYKSALPTWHAFDEHLYTQLVANENKVIRWYGLSSYISIESSEVIGYAFGLPQCMPMGEDCYPSETAAYQAVADSYGSSVCRAEYNLPIDYRKFVDFSLSYPAPEGWQGAYSAASNNSGLRLWTEYSTGGCPAETSTPGVNLGSNMRKTVVANCPAGLEPTDVGAPSEDPDLPFICSTNGWRVPVRNDSIIGRLTSVCSPTEGNPCSPMNGNKLLSETDYEGQFLAIERHYISSKQFTSNQFGQGWNHNYAQKIQYNNGYFYIQPSGMIESFAPLGNGVYRSKFASGTRLEVMGDLAQLTKAGGYKEVFERVAGTYSVTPDTFRLLEIHRPQSDGRSITFEYDPDSGNLLTVTGPDDRQILYSYTSDNQVSSVLLPDGNLIDYGYDATKNLQSVTYQDSSVKNYLYEDPAHPTHITGIVDENGNRYATYSYDQLGKVILSEHAGGAGRVMLNYVSPNSTVVTTPTGDTRTYTFDSSKPGFDVNGITDGTGSVTVQRNADGWPTQRVDTNGNITRFGYDEFHRTSISKAVGTPEERLTETDWDNTINRISERREPGKTTSYTFNARGQTLTRTETDTSTLATRTWTYTYYELPSIAALIGQVASVNGPRSDVTDVTTYNYYTTDDVAGMYLKGDLHTVTNALGHVTEYLEYDGNGRPLQVRDANNVVTTTTYHVRGWINSRTTDGQTTSFAYDNVGNLTRVTQPDGSFTDYEYDDAHRLDAIADNFNNRIEYTLDAAGNRTAENTYNDLGVLRRQMSRVYDQLNRLQKVIDGNLDEMVYGYDNNGNRTNTLDPNLKTTSFEYDPLDRLVKTIDATLGETLMAYDTRDQLETVTDPLGNTTTYSYDGLDNQVQLNSPDTGITIYAYDDAGNRTAATEARGVRVDYVYDALNRLIFTDYSDNSLDVSFTYDAGVNGKGRLTSMTDAAGTETYSYGARGNLTSVVRLIGSSSYTTSYAYNGADRLIQITYPSGMVVDYTLDVAGRVTAVDKTVKLVTENLLNNVVYEPFGPVSNFSYGNGLVMDAIFDQDYELDQLQAGPGLDWIFGYDDSGNILTITDQANSANNQTFTYDGLYRLDTAAGEYGNENFDYDANGNRTRYLSDAVDEVYTYETSSNRLATQNGWSFNRDAAGNRLDKLNDLGYGKLYSYGDNNRLSNTIDRDVSGDVVAGSYVYDGKGQRVSKTVDGATTHFIYGLTGELLSEHRDDGSHDIEYVYFNGRPIAQVSQQLKVVQPPGKELIMDNDAAGTSSSGAWSIKTDAQSYGADYRVAKKKARNIYRWTASPPGINYEVYAWWVSRKGNSSKVEYTIAYGLGETATLMKSHKNGGGQWQLLGNFHSADGSDYIEVNAAGGKTSADAIKWVEIPEPIITLVDTTNFIHTDHLGTPRTITDDTQTVIWRWDSTPFGDSKPKEDPDGDSNTFTLNLRFPGQYYDAESELHYNYFRDYDASTGRYVESDPIGLDGGLNTFGYANNNSLLNLDRSGLAYFAFRPLQAFNGPNNCASGTMSDRLNIQQSHEQLFFEDGKQPRNLGFFSDSRVRQDKPKNLADYDCQSVKYNDCLMRKAVSITVGGAYCLLGVTGAKNNCQDWASRVKANYRRLESDPSVYEQCFGCNDQ